MGDLKFWKILRVLTTNKCNYSCPFCHNEGQGSKENNVHILKFADFKVIIDSLRSSRLKEVHFSGGEPFLNPEIVEMICYTDKSTELEIGCATNISLLTEEIIKELAKTRIKLNIQFPSIENCEYKEITQNGNLDIVLENIQILKLHNIRFGLNHVITNNNSDRVNSVINFAQNHNCHLKLLPNLFDDHLSENKNEIYPLLDSISLNKIDKGTGAIKWILHSKDCSLTNMIYVEPPCYSGNFDHCKEFAEIRLLPDLRLQTCIKQVTPLELNCEILEENHEIINNRFQELWNNFISC